MVSHTRGYRWFFEMADMSGLALLRGWVVFRG